MTVQGHDSTLPVTVADIAYHTAAVRRGAPNCLLLADLPFMAYATPEQAFENAATVMRAGANMVKIEGGEWLVETVQMLTERARSSLWSFRPNPTVSKYFRWLQSPGARR
ncbi:3-methyl-2-oxobutanoate hydroxymethyltransferase [Escherichia coli]|nr:3-methyl-2-oxobutanoate hydroxymethyltransferase [Escherichia coli]